MRTPSTITRSTAALRCELEWLRSRYDGGKISPAIFSVIRKLESDIAWAERREVRP